MTKTVSRIVAVVLLILAVLLVGYSCFTGNRVASYPENLDGYKRQVFQSNNGTMVAFMEDKAWSRTSTPPMVLLEMDEYKEGVITMKREEQVYEFIAVDEKTIYDMQTKELLVRRGDG